MKNLKKIIVASIITLFLTGCSPDTSVPTAPNIPDIPGIAEVNAATESVENTEDASEVITSEDSKSSLLYVPEFFIPEYSGQSGYIVNDNIPFFSKDAWNNLSDDEYYSDLDSLNRPGIAYAIISKKTMPADGEERGEIGMIKPAGWHTVKYDCIDGKYLYNRCHIIGWQLGAENANEKNLVTGTRYMNLQMLQHENMVADYIRNGGDYIYFRVTPVYTGDNLLCDGLLMEGWSDDDSLMFNIFYYNVQPGIMIDYLTGDNEYSGVFLDTTGAGVVYEEEVTTAEDSSEATYILNTNSKKIHLPSCSSISDMNEKNKKEYHGSLQELIDKGYTCCKNCNPH